MTSMVTSNQKMRYRSPKPPVIQSSTISWEGKIPQKSELSDPPKPLLKPSVCCNNNLMISSLSLDTAMAKGVKPWVFYPPNLSGIVTSTHQFPPPRWPTKQPLTRTRRSALELIRTRKAPTCDVAAAKCKARPRKWSKKMYLKVDAFFILIYWEKQKRTRKRHVLYLMQMLVPFKIHNLES